MNRVAQAARISSLAALTGIVCNYLVFLAGLGPFIVDRLAEWIMARTPSWAAVLLLEHLGAWAKPFAATGALAAIGGALLVGCALRGPAPALCLSVLLWAFGSLSWSSLLTLVLPAAAVAMLPPRAFAPGRRAFGVAVAGGTVFVAFEAWARERQRSLAAPPARRLFTFHPPPAVTPVADFYSMSKNTVDPSIDSAHYRLHVTIDGKPLREFSYGELAAMPQRSQYSTLRCISNTLKSDLMGTALWTGLRLSQFISRAAIPGHIREVAFIGIDGHGDSLPVDYAFSDAVLLAMGMNGKTLERIHGFPLRLIAPRYYGFKNIKWLDEIRFTSTPYLGTWPAMGWQKEAYVHTASHIEKIDVTGNAIRVSGVSFAGDRGISRVIVRSRGGSWVDAKLETPLSPLSSTRWVAELPARTAAAVEARACDGRGTWQLAAPKPMFPDGVAGPTEKLL